MDTARAPTRVIPFAHAGPPTSTAVSDADVAFTYAWWLTGDAGAAEAAVRRAWEQVRDLAPEGRAVALLEAVRTRAIDRPTMCPASELAVLHDAHGLDLPEAARLCRVDLADARVELAHGRLEALLETVREPFAHPERLGGLAVGNPPDVAHARQCDNCATVERLLRQGRDTLREIPPPPTPAELRQLLEPETEPKPPPPVERVQSGPDEAQNAPATASQEAEAEPAEEAPAEEDTPRRLLFDDTLDPLEEAELPPELPERRRNWLLPAVVALAIVLLAVTLATALRPGAGLPEPSATSSAVTATGAPPVGQSSSAPAAPAGFSIDAVGLIRRGEFAPAGPGLVLTPTDRVRLAVRYAGATDGVMLEGHWSVDGSPFRELRVALSSRQSMHVFTSPVPEDGWPAGLHHVVLTVGGAVVAGIDFRVV